MLVQCIQQLVTNTSARLNIWLGKNDDSIQVTSIPSNNEAEYPLRTTTQVHGGDGYDWMDIDLVDLEGSLFVANGQNHDDFIDASDSTLSVILFGDDGDDQLIGGSNDDVIIGDFGRISWRSSDNVDNPDGVIEAYSGFGGYGDFTDGVRRNITDVVSISTDLGGYGTSPHIGPILLP